ncbi:3'(2'),5'-bisphosphate nucleotidase CysQ [Methylocystis sp. SB2]|uniref:3'(2'),5'-bisphosphate nucleotidase CysQ n=1 Tax=Methylocystis sp. (strain SB2) TaxID=743836 RepID=UPI00040941D8|nr:3'(2'),5'-bisphosphate nucleotidase CysQ [Methylocystis sp. SB2]ULO24929.1 3'(2'),5'-bisphosphate nucleotidase CysQ [Methylocystis sp. SB2]
MAGERFVQSASASGDIEDLARLFANMAIAAGALAMETLANANIESRLKGDTSPVTEADERIEAYLLRELEAALPGVPFLAEESVARGKTLDAADAFLLIDPIDGTREFLARSSDFTINVALAEKNAPRVGAVYAPAQGRIWFAGAQGYEAQAVPGGSLPPMQDWRPLRARQRPPEGLVALISKSHLDEATKTFLSRQRIARSAPVGSSIKFCLLANGEADVYPRFGPTMEWDTAAGDAVLRAAGGVTLDPDGAPLRYGKKADDYRNGPFIAWADAAALEAAATLP